MGSRRAAPAGGRSGVQVVIVGPGALGCFLAARFRGAGVEVHLVDYKPERAARLRTQGLLVRQPEGETLRVLVPVALPADTPPADLVILTVKAHQTAAAAAALPRLVNPAGVALTLQNGLGNLEEMAAVLGPERLLGGSTLLGVTRLGEGEVVLAGVGTTFLGRPRGSRVTPAGVEAVAALFRRAGLPCEIAADLERVLWEKLLVNVGINPLTALLRVKNGLLPQSAAAWELAVAAATEAQAVARAEGIELESDPAARLLAVCRATAGNRSSMLQDILAGRPTEIGALNGQVVRRGREHGVPTPVNEVLVKLILALETLSPENPR